MTDILNSSDVGGYSTNPSRPDYACPAYVEMAPRWSLVDDFGPEGGTVTVREKKDRYLPKFEAETLKDWDARVSMTFVADHYATTLAEHVGMVTAEPIRLGEDVPPAIKELCEDIDGEGNHLDVFMQSALESAMHHGHCVLFTDYPAAEGIKTKRDEKVAQVRPYVQLYKAADVLSWDYATVGGVRVLVRIMLRENVTEPDGEFGVKPCRRYREIKQAVSYEPITGRATSLGAITYRIWKQEAEGFISAGEGTITGPARIAARVVYGGPKRGPLHSTPHLYGLALLNLKETQIESDYANVMHKCNVPSPIFIGLPQDDKAPTIIMGQGIRIPIGGDAKILEPAGTAIAGTRTRLADLHLDMQRHGASSAQGEGGPVLSATEAAQYAKARNARIRRAARSLQDALEGVLADMAAFMGLSTTGSVKSGGSLTVTQNFAGVTIDPAYLTLLVTAYRENAITLEECRAALQTGELPETFDPDDVDALIAREKAKQDQEQIERDAETERLKAVA